MWFIVMEHYANFWSKVSSASGSSRLAGVLAGIVRGESKKKAAEKLGLRAWTGWKKHGMGSPGQPRGVFIERDDLSIWRHFFFVPAVIDAFERDPGQFRPITRAIPVFLLHPVEELTGRLPVVRRAEDELSKGAR